MNADFDISGVALETDRLILREWYITDLDDLYEYASVDGVGENAGEGAGHDGFHAGNVAGHAGDDIPLVGGSEEPLGHLLQVPVHLVAHVIGNVLRDPVVQVVLADTDQV